MFKKLVLLIVGGVAAAGGFFYYVNLPKEEAAALADSLSRQKVNLENIARNIAESDVVRNTIERSKEALVESPQVQSWLNDSLQHYAQQQQVELSEQEAQELVDRLMELRRFSRDAEVEASGGSEGYSAAQQQRFDEILSRGDQSFRQHLGIPMNQFLTTLSKSSLKQSLEKMAEP